MKEQFPETVFAVRLLDGSLKFTDRWQDLLGEKGALVGEYRFYGMGSMTTGDGKPRPELRVVKGFNP